MEIYSKGKNYELYKGNMLDMLDNIQANTIDSIVTDPPYELNFMNKGWDNAGISFNKETWKKCYEVLKPGGYLLAFGGSRTHHRIAVAIEDAGFEIRDTIMWLYGSGFPKSMDISKSVDKRSGVQGEKIGERTFGKTSTGQSSGWHNNNIAQLGKQDIFAPATELAKQWQGWGTQLKPSFEPIIVARKPFKGSLVDNVIEWGVGGINIDECRVESSKEDIDKLNKEWDREWNTSYKSYAENVGGSAGFDYSNARTENKGLSGRFPANTILTYDQLTFDEVCGGFPNTKQNGSIKNPNLKNSLGNNGIYNKYSEKQPLWNAYQDSGSASRYFYCAKASKKDRDEGLDEFEEKQPACVTDFRPTLATHPENWNNGNPVDNPMMRITPRKNIHPTVKPTELMQYLVRLVTPNGGTILDPFNGSGSTGKAVMYENKERNKNYKYIGIELEEEYLKISNARIKYVEE